MTLLQRGTNYIIVPSLWKIITIWATQFTI